MSETDQNQEIILDTKPKPFVFGEGRGRISNIDYFFENSGDHVAIRKGSAWAEGDRKRRVSRLGTQAHPTAGFPLSRE